MEYSDKRVTKQVAEVDKTLEIIYNIQKGPHIKNINLFLKNNRLKSCL